MAAELGWPRFPGFAPRVLDELASHAWPGNVRELKNVVERALYRWGDADRPVGQLVLDPFDSPWRPAPLMPVAPVAASAATPTPAAPSAAAPEPTGDLRAAVAAHEKMLLEQALDRHRHNQRRTAAALGLSYDQLRHALKRHGLLGE
jgi:psp operon transcriptional activator